MERVAPVPRAEGEMLRDWRAETVHASISMEVEAACVGCGCWDGGGTEE
jgi:hypothetical protein